MTLVHFSWGIDLFDLDAISTDGVNFLTKEEVAHFRSENFQDSLVCVAACDSGGRGGGFNHRIALEKTGTHINVSSPLECPLLS